MWQYHPELLATPVPRYTSFPTAAEFGDCVGADDMGSALDGVAADAPISLYLHIPYCHQLCWYCGCNTGASNRTSRVAAYIQRLGEEIDLVARRLDGRGRVQRIAWGGGSPNAVTPTEFDALMQRVRSAFAISDATTSVEIDPRGFDSAWATALSRNRVTRVSLGVQTFAPHIQAAIGRVQPINLVATVVARLRANGITSLNFDLMYGLPDQSAADLDATIMTALSLAPDRLAVFGYAHVPHMAPRQTLIDTQALPGPEVRFAQAAQAHRRLVDEGYQAIGFDHFARPSDAIAIAARNGVLRRNFQGFTEDQAQVLIGLGASSISAFPDLLVQNEKNTGRYHLRIANQGLAAARGIWRTPLDKILAQAIEQLLCAGSADLTGVPGLAAIRAQLEPFEARGIVAWRGGRLNLDPDGLPYARSVAATLDPYRTPAAARFSGAI